MLLNDIVKVRLVTYAVDQVAFNVLYYRVSGVAGTGATDAQIAAGFDNAFHTAYKGCMAAPATWRGVGIQKIFPLPPGLETTSIANQGPGTIVGELLPLQTTGMLTKRSVFAGRKYRGRVYVAFPGEADNTTGAVPGAGYVAALTTLGTALQTVQTFGVAGNTNTLQPILWHKATSSYDQWTSFVPRQKWAVQHRRGNYGRPNSLPF